MALATVDLLPGKDWNAKAAAGDALSRAPLDAPFVAIWIDEHGVLRYALSSNSPQTLSTFSVYLAHMAMNLFTTE